jgi:hypothetical protein
MRVGIVRTDLGKGVYISDVESRDQRDFSMQPPGQSRNVRLPTDTELANFLAPYASQLAIKTIGSDVAATVDTTTGPNNVLRIRAFPTASFTVITVTAGLAVAKATIATDLNTGFTGAGLPFLASVVGTNQIQIKAISPNVGSTAYLEIDTTAHGSNLNTAVGFAAGGVIASGISTATLVADIKTAVYPSPTTINVSTANIIAVDNINLLSPTDQTNLVNGVADLVAPSFVETGSVLLSFVSGVISKIRNASYRPDGVRTGYATGIAAAVVKNDGVTPFTFP